MNTDLTGKITSIRNQWLAAAKRLDIHPRMGTQYTEMRKAFYAGSISLLLHLEKEVAELSDDDGVLAMDMWADECKIFWKEEIKRWDDEQSQ